MKPIVLFMFLMAFCSGCNSDSRTGKQYGVLADKSEKFSIALDITLLRDDHLSLYYTTDGSTNFFKIKPLWKDVKGSAKKQQVVFRLPEKIRPTQLRIDLGTNPQQQDIKLWKITMGYKGKTVELPGTLIFSYFRADVTKTEADPTTGIIRSKVISGVKQSPSLYPKEGPLSEEIEKLLE